jgi:hypothetical protein
MPRNASCAELLWGGRHGSLRDRTGAASTRLRRERIQPMVDDLIGWMRVERAKLSRHDDLAAALAASSPCAAASSSSCNSS